MSVPKKQFSFMPEKSTMELLFCRRQRVEKYREKKKKLCMVFVDLEKGYNSAARSFKMGVSKKKILKTYINVVEDMYKRSNTSVKSTYGEHVQVTVGVHQETALSLYLFSLVI